jgi:RimJ/RimL family protein N-acetyltransferase
MNFLPHPTPRLVLRRFERRDAEPLVPLIGDRAIAEFTSRIPHPYTIDDAKAFLGMLEKDPGKCIAAVTLDHAVIGGIGLEMDPANDRAELGYWVARSHWNKGYATEAARAMVAIGFDHLKLNRVVAHHFTRNPSSGRVLDKAGMHREGLLRQHLKKWGAYEDCVAYGLTRDQYEEARRGT